MSLTALVTSNTRYKFDVNNKERVPTNFVRDDSYLTQRAAGAGDIKDGASSGQKRKGHLDASNHFGMDTSLHPTEDDQAPDSTDSTPVANGGSPSLDFVESALTCGVLCSKCVLGKNGTREGEIGNPTEISILRAAYFSGVDVEKSKTGNPIVAEVPFSSEYKFMATIHDDVDADNYTVFVKGAPDRMGGYVRTRREQ